MKFGIGNKLVRRPYHLWWEIASETGTGLEGPSGDFVKMAFTVPS